jgi:aryl-alcohol dehydrogenase-like predicted oxidoreductase
METRKIGALSVSIVGIGCNNFGGRIDRARTREVIDAAIGAGINFFDTADMYADGKSEELLGVLLGRRRGDVIIATKFATKWSVRVEARVPSTCGRRLKRA